MTGWLMALALGPTGVVFAQLPAGIQVNNPQIPIYRETARGQIMDAMITFRSAASAGGRQEMLVRQFDMRTFKDGDTNLLQLRALAPQCRMNLATKIASDPGPLQIFTPTTNLWVQGRGFYCDQSQRVLILSNDVETRIVKGLLKAPMLGGVASNANAGEVVHISADYCHFDSLANEIKYVGHVRVHDADGDSSSRSMTIYLTTNNAVRGILARDEVSIDMTNRGRATADMAFYVVTNGAERVRLTGNAVWRNGAEEAKAGEFLYDSVARTLNATNHVRVRWPNPPASAKTFVELFSDDAMLQWPSTNGPIEKMTAEGGVILVNQSDQSRATGQQALYDRTIDLFQLTGQPVWWNDQTEVRGDKLSMELTNKVYRAQGSARLTTREVSLTNRSLTITCDHLQFQTNLAEFYDNVLARVFQNGVLQDLLKSRLLTTIMVSNKIQTAIARGDVHGETVPDTLGVTKTLSCETLTARRSITTGLMTQIVGQDNVVIKEFGGVKPAFETLWSDRVTVFFSAVTNRVEKATAAGHVALEQRKNAQTIHASSELAVYLAGTNELMTLSGNPLAQTDKYVIANSDSLLWQPQGNGFRAQGRYRIIPISAKAENVGGLKQAKAP